MNKLKIIILENKIFGKYEDRNFVIVPEEDLFDQIQEASEEEDFELIEEMIKDHLKEQIAQEQLKKQKKELLDNSKFITLLDSFYYFHFNNVLIKTPIPEILVDKIILAEMKNDLELIETYYNFWKFAAKNPNSEARDNMLRFMDKYNVSLSKQGYIISYRFVIPKNVNFEAKYLPEDIIKISKFYHQYKDDYIIKTMTYNTISKNFEHLKSTENKLSVEEQFEEINNLSVFTDGHTHTFNIKVGELVYMPRIACDESQENTCSKGLHSASFEWLKHNAYFGSVAMIVLINPRDVVSVPMYDSYGKMRSCSYFPISVFKFGNDISEEDLKDFKITDGFVSGYEKALEDAEEKIMAKEISEDENTKISEEELYQVFINEFKNFSSSEDVQELVFKFRKNESI